MIPDWLDHELHNWGRWCHSGEPVGPPIQRQAASIEGRYLAESDMGDKPPPKPPVPNRERAEVVHRVYVDLMDRRERRVLVLRYVSGYSAKRVPKLMRISHEMYAASLVSAARMIGEAFRTKEARCSTQGK